MHMQETKILLLTGGLCISKSEFIGICYGGFIIPLIFCIPKILGKEFLTLILINSTKYEGYDLFEEITQMNEKKRANTTKKMCSSSSFTCIN